MISLGAFIATTAILTLAGCDKGRRTYSANCSIPLAHWGTEKDGTGHLMVVLPVLIGSDGSILWNSERISDAKLRSLMSKASELNPQPQIVLEVSPSAECKRVEEVRQIMDKAPICKGRYSLCSEGWNWKQWPEVGGP
jgi:hypothetical protein